MPEFRVEPTPLEGLLVVRPAVFPDERGFFLEPYRVERYAPHGIAVDAQDNHSRSSKGVLRGLHFQIDPGQAKLMRCGRGRIWDVAVDVRLGSPTYGEWFGIELDDVDHAQLYVPVGFAHGFAVLSEIADVLYKTSAPYDGATERGIAWDDPDLAIDWKVDSPLVSARDTDAARLADFDWTGTVWQTAQR
jgi:dTDP-4-dehydrorhamnose 3,5-epimerase